MSSLGGEPHISPWFLTSTVYASFRPFQSQFLAFQPGAVINCVNVQVSPGTPAALDLTDGESICPRLKRFETCHLMTKLAPAKEFQDHLSMVLTLFCVLSALLK